MLSISDKVSRGKREYYASGKNGIIKTGFTSSMEQLNKMNKVYKTINFKNWISGTTVE